MIPQFVKLKDMISQKGGKLISVIDSFIIKSGLNQVIFNILSASWGITKRFV
jgi:hypothetical protein